MIFDPSVLICGNLCLWFQIRHICSLEGFYAFKLVSRDARELSESFSSNPGPYLMSFDPSLLICGICAFRLKKVQGSPPPRYFLPVSGEFIISIEAKLFSSVRIVLTYLLNFSFRIG